MNITLQSISCKIIKLIVNSTDTLQCLYDKLLEENETTLEWAPPKFIYRGKQLDLAKKMEDYGIVEGSKIIYVISKQPNKSSNEQEKLPISEPIDSENVEDQNLLPQTYIGLPLQVMRSIIIEAILRRVVQDGNITEMLANDENTNILRSASPTEFNRIITNPIFLTLSTTHRILAPPLAQNDGEELEEELEESSEGSEGENHVEDGKNVLLSEQDKNNLSIMMNNIVEMGVEITDAELIQMYLISERDITRTLDFLFNSR